jgi:hypothetical protein
MVYQVKQAFTPIPFGLCNSNVPERGFDGKAVEPSLNFCRRLNFHIGISPATNFYNPLYKLLAETAPRRCIWKVILDLTYRYAPPTDLDLRGKLIVF